MPEPSVQGLDELEIDVEIDVEAVVAAILKNPTALGLIAKAVRDQLTKDVRTTGNLYGHWAGTSPSTGNTGSTSSGLRS